MGNPRTTTRLQQSLGKPVKIYSGRSVTWEDFFLWVLPGVLIPLGIMAYGTYVLVSGDDRAGLSPRGWFLFAAAALLPFGILAARRFSSARKAVLLYANGLRLRNIPAQHHAVLWRQVNGIRTAGTRYHFFGLPISDSFSLAVQPVHGREFVIPDQIEEIEELSERIKEGVYPLLLADLTEDVRQGHPLHFGDVVVEKDRIVARGKATPWEEVGSFWVESGSLIFEKGEKSRVRIPADRVTNLELLLQIIAQHFTAD